jgi:ribonuclease III
MSKMPHFENLELLKQALTHRSFLSENNLDPRLSNERLEFLGDAILELWVRKELFLRCPKLDEGSLSIIRTGIVCSACLGEVARSIDLGKYLILSKGEEKAGGRENDTLLSNALESIIGALYLDQDYQAVNAWLMAVMIPFLEETVNKKTHKDSKSLLQEMTQKTYGELPVYKILSEKGQDHEKIFVVAVMLQGKQISKGSGKSIQKAEIEAARKTLMILEERNRNGRKTD